LTHSQANGKTEYITEGQCDMQSMSGFFGDRALTHSAVARGFAMRQNNFVTHWSSTNGLTVLLKTAEMRRAMLDG
jgi:hypothetical protein